MRKRRKTLKKGPPGARGGPEFVFYPNLIFFVTKNAVQNFITLRQPLLGEKYVACKERKVEKKNNPKNSGHFVTLQRLRAAQTLRSKKLSLIFL